MRRKMMIEAEISAPLFAIPIIMKTIKELRSNFIRRHQLSPDFFTVPSSSDPEESPLLLKQLP